MDHSAEAVSNLLGLSADAEAEVKPIESSEDEPTGASEPLPSPHSNLKIEVSDEGAESGEPISEVLSPSALVLVPSLRGHLQYSNGNVLVCRGMWAISDDQHGRPDQTSEFEFKLVKAFDDQSSFPISGKYSGYFMLRQPPPNKSLKIEEKEILLRFTADPDSAESAEVFKVDGHGSNRFGSFNLRGTFNAADKSILLFKDYVSPATAQQPKKAASRTTPSSGSKKPETPSLSAVNTPRESSGRIRKPSTTLQGFEDPLARRPSISGSKEVKAASADGSADIGASSSAKPSSSGVGSVPKKPTIDSSNRAQRLPSHLVKCGEVLKELTKHPQSVWFLEPVDHVKLGIPDYPTIVKQPMDFQTIKENIEAARYETPEQFGDDMRLVFKNAMAYNSAKDHPVHIAAKELNYKFDERFRQLMAHFLAAANAHHNALAAAAAVGPEPKAPASRHSIGGSSKSSHSSKAAGRASLGGADAARRGTGKPARPLAPAWKGPKTSSAGPRSMEAFLPPAVDVNAAHLVEMQKKMTEMQEEILALRTAMRQSEIKTTLETQRDAARNPLSYEEKKELISRIQNLPSEKMDHVIQIIQAAMPKRADGSDEMEVPLDDLDTMTLRKLQQYVKSCTAKKKRVRPSTGGGDGGASKASSALKKRPSTGGEGEMMPSKSPRPSDFHDSEGIPGSSSAAPPSGDDDHMLFSPDALEEIDGGNLLTADQVDF